MRLVSLVFVVTVLILSSCYEQPDCLINNTNLFQITLRAKTSTKDTTVLFTSIRVLKDSGELYSNTSLNKLTVPLHVLDSITTVVFKYKRDTIPVSDTLVIGYVNQSRVINPDCGAFLYQINAHIPKTNFVKTKVTTPVLINTVTKNLEIYL